MQSDCQQLPKSLRSALPRHVPTIIQHVLARLKLTNYSSYLTSYLTSVDRVLFLVSKGSHFGMDVCADLCNGRKGQTGSAKCGPPGMQNTMDLREEIEIYLRSRFTVLWIASYEEDRIITTLKALCEKTGRRLVTWDIAAWFRGIVEPGGGGTLPDARDPKTALEAIAKAEDTRDAVFVLKDFHNCLDRQPVITRQLRNLAQALNATRKTIVITSPTAKVPDDLKDDVFLIEFPPPDLDELKTLLDRFTQTPKIRVNLTPLGREKILRSALGLSANQVQRVFGKAIVAEVKDPNGRVVKPAGLLDETSIDMITQEKKAIIRESGALEFFSPQETIADVGGLEVLKGWLRQREKAFTKEARDYGLPAPKGLALIGIPGTGKSLTAKMAASLWHLPLIRMDVGALFGGLVGQSEENTRRALTLVETIAPCLLWIDEMEKAFAQGGLDGGTSQVPVGQRVGRIEMPERLELSLDTRHSPL